MELKSQGLCVRMSLRNPAVVFVGGLGGLLMMWNTATNTRTPLKGHEDNVWSLCVSQDGAAVASGCQDGEVRLWDAATGRCLWTSQKQPNCVLDIQMHGDTVFCGLLDFNAVGLRRSDGKATRGALFKLSSPFRLAVARGEEKQREGEREGGKREMQGKSGEVFLLTLGASSVVRSQLERSAPGRR
jgi:hypothetical protein